MIRKKLITCYHVLQLQVCTTVIHGVECGRVIEKSEKKHWKLIERSRKKHRKHIGIDRALHFGAKARVTWKAHENIGEEHDITQGRTEVEAKLFRLIQASPVGEEGFICTWIYGCQGIKACVEEDGYQNEWKSSINRISCWVNPVNKRIHILSYMYAISRFEARKSKLT